MSATIERRAPYRRDHEASVAAGMARGAQPKTLSALLRWFGEGMAAECPQALHTAALWRDHGTHAEGGSQLGTRAWSDPMRRLMEDRADQTDQEGLFLRPMRAALHRLGRRWPMTERALWAVALTGVERSADSASHGRLDWQSVGSRGHWDMEMWTVFVEAALVRLWLEYRDVEVRLA